MTSSRLTQLVGATILVVALAGLAGCGEEPAPQQAQGGAMPVTVARPLQRRIVEWDRYLGRLEAVESVELRARVSGYLQQIHFREGAMVKAGDPLFSIDPRPLEAEAARARAELAGTRAQLEVARAQKIQAEAGLAEVVARKSQFDSLLDLATKRNERAQRAAAGDAIAAETVEVRQSELQQARANVEAAAAEIASAKAAIATADSSVSAAESSIAAAQAALDRSELDLSYCVVKAPIAGRIGRELVSVGNFITGGGQGATLLATIVSTDPVHCYFDADEAAALRYLRLAKQGRGPAASDLKSPVRLALIDEEGFPHAGHLDFIDNRVDKATGSLRVRAILRNESGLLLPGLFCTICVPASEPHEALLVPDEAVVSDQSARFVWTVAADGSVVRKDIRLGPLALGLRAVTAGLDGSELVVIRGLQRIRPGAPVMPQEEAISAEERQDGLPNEFRPLPESEWITRESDR